MFPKNVKLIKIRSGLDDDIDLIVAPELYISGYPIDDLVLREDFLVFVEAKLRRLQQPNQYSALCNAP